VTLRKTLWSKEDFAIYRPIDLFAGIGGIRKGADNAFGNVQKQNTPQQADGASNFQRSKLQGFVYAPLRSLLCGNKDFAFLICYYYFVLIIN